MLNQDNNIYVIQLDWNNQEKVGMNKYRIYAEKSYD